LRVQFDGYCLDSDRRELRVGDTLVPTQPQVFDLLEYLIANRDRVITKDDLISSIWKGRIVSESTLLSRINAARRAIGDDGGRQRLIRTVARKGIGFVGTVLTLSVEETGPSAATSLPLATLPGKKIQSNVNDLQSDKPSIVVLPFTNMSGDPEQAYFVDGLVEDIITALSRISWFLVVARKSSFSYKGRALKLGEIKKEMGVRYVLAGSVRKADSRLRITAQLLDADTGNHIWAGRYDGGLADVFDLQDQITSNVVVAIEPKVQDAEILRAQAKSTNSLTAYDLYLRALNLHWQRTVESTVRVLEFLNQAVTIDPNFSSAYGLIAQCYVNRVSLLHLPFLHEEVARGLEAAKLAIETGADNPDALTRGGWCIAYLGQRPKEGLSYIDRALALNPNSSMATLHTGMVLMMLGDHERALEFFAKTLRLSPLQRFAADVHLASAVACFCKGQFDDALNSIEKVSDEGRTAGLIIKVAAMVGANRPPAEVQELVQLLLANRSLVSIRSVRQTMGCFRPMDAETFIAALRKAGIPD
jgi:TolB-like protein/Tfp pilus assembly protein PilF